MCIFHISHYRCGHDIKKLVHECDKYLGKKAEAGNLLCKVLSFTRPKTCGGRNVMLEEDIMSACGAACARKLHENMKRHQRELKRKDKELEKREKDRLGRAQAVAREYRQHKQKEEEALRRQKEEREQKERREREKERTGKSEQAIVKNIQPLWHTARGGTDVCTMRSSQPVVQQVPPTRTEAQRALPRLADRRVIPQAYRQPPTNPGTHPLRSQANVDSLGRQRQGAQSKPNLPFGSGTSRSGSSVSRSNARHVGRHQEGTLDDPRVRIQPGNRSGLTRRQVQGPPTQAVAAQAVAAQKPAMVRSPTNVPQPVCARVDSWSSSVTSSVGQVQSRPTQGQPSTARSPGKPETSPRPSVPANTEFRPPVPPKDHRRPVLPKDTWQPQHPNLVPAPLSLRAKPPARAARVPAQQPPPRGQLNGIRRDLLELDDRLSAPKRTVPKRKPVPVSNTAPARAQAPSQLSGAVPGYRPNPMLANKADKKPAQVSAIKPEKKRNPWFKRLVGAPSSDTVDSVEWVSADAARVERGE